MFTKFKNSFQTKGILKVIFVLPVLTAVIYPNFSSPTKAGLEFQWGDNPNYKKLRWFQRNGKKKSRNKIFFFLRPSDRKTGLLKINVKIPDNFKSKIKPNKISVCKVQIGGFDRKTKCIEDVKADVEINLKTNNLDIYPFTPIPSDKDSYAVIFNVINPQRSGLYQFHSFGQSSGKVPVSYYLGSWTLKIDQL
tara:strand:- start:10478 stop:11056 length:579 start_codon:yes stop_codon:yes gene_type:complete